MHCIGWSDKGIFNFEGGCYAKCINLRKEAEPQIWNAITVGSVLENVVIDPVSNLPLFNDQSLTENTRVAYPLEYIPGAVTPSIGKTRLKYDYVSYIVEFNLNFRETSKCHCISHR